MSSKHTVDKALTMLRSLPRVCLSNVRDNPGSKSVSQVLRCVYLL